MPNSIGLDEAKGAMITKVTEDGPAAKQDLKPGDVIVEVNGEKIEDSRDLARKIAELHPDTDVKLAIVRYGDKRQVTMKLGTFPSNKKLAALEEEKPADTGEQMKDLGLSLAPATKFPGAGEEGVVITEVDPESDAADKGLKPGDVILQVAGLTVSEPVRCRRRRQEGNGRRQVDGQGHRQSPDAGQNRRSDALRGAFPEEGFRRLLRRRAARFPPAAPPTPSRKAHRSDRSGLKQRRQGDLQPCVCWSSRTIKRPRPSSSGR